MYAETKNLSKTGWAIHIAHINSKKGNTHWKKYLETV
jgi:hypothetical protein